MTDTQAGAPNGEEQAPGIRVLAQYTRDLSFENPRAPDSLRVTGEQPAIDIGVELNAKGRPDGLFEVELKLVVDAKKGDLQSFAIELVYGGLFELAMATLGAILAGLVGLSIGWTVALGFEAALLARLVYGVAADVDAGLESPGINRKYYGEYPG